MSTLVSVASLNTAALLYASALNKLSLANKAVSAAFVRVGRSVGSPLLANCENMMRLQDQLDDHVQSLSVSYILGKGSLFGADPKQSKVQALFRNRRKTDIATIFRRWVYILRGLLAWHVSADSVRLRCGASLRAVVQNPSTPFVVSNKDHDDAPVRHGEGQLPPQHEQSRQDAVTADIEAVVAQQRSVTRSVPNAPSADAVLEVDWQLVMSKSGLQSQLAAMQVSIAANERAQNELRAADAQLDKRVAGSEARIAEHHQRLAELEERRHIQSAQLDILHNLQHKPAQLLFYRTLLINIESVFLSCKAVMGGFVDLGGDAASSKALTGAAKATKVCGAVLSLLPGGALINGAANLTAAAFEHANASRRHNIVTQLSKKGVAGGERCCASTDCSICGATRAAGASRTDGRRQQQWRWLPFVPEIDVWCGRGICNKWR
jgi:hypothetical protein